MLPFSSSGESGTGKELVAGAIHNGSRRAAQPFVKVNCASIPDTLLESEMFGHEKGAFTDAIQQARRKAGAGRPGHHLPRRDRRHVRPHAAQAAARPAGRGVPEAGGDGDPPHGVRLIAATNRDVDDLLARGTFREDLFYRLSVVTIHLPALRERKDDLDLLVRHFLRFFSANYGKEIEDVSQDVRDILFRHDWPGNVRELRNCIERAVIFCDSPVIREEHLPAQYLKMRDQGFPDSLDALYEKLSRQKISEALAVSSGEKQKAARLLNISRKTLYNRMKKLGME